MRPLSWRGPEPPPKGPPHPPPPPPGPPQHRLAIQISGRHRLGEMQEHNIRREIDSLERIDVAVGDDMAVHIEPGSSLQIRLESLHGSAGPADNQHTGQHGVTTPPNTGSRTNPKLSAGSVTVKGGAVIVMFNPGMFRGMV